MGTIIDLTDGRDHDVLHTTEADGLFGGSYLDGQPLAAYLEPDEQPAYVLQNKKSGLTIDDGTQRTLTPGSDFRAFAVVTDLRVLFVVGQAGGEDSVALDLADIVEATAESGLRSGTLTIEALDGEQWTFPCTDDPSAVATHIEEAAQVWANAARLLDDVEVALGRAEDDLSAGEFEAAGEGVDGLEETIETALHRIQEVGPAAHARIDERAEELRSWLTDLDRELIAGAGARAHARAQSAWQASEYERAATAYDRAIERYQTALDTDGSTPESRTLWARLRAGAAERELLRVGPIVDADTARRRALALADPEDAAGEWERALELYRDLLGLDWGQGGAFVADYDRIREQTSEIADDAIGDHYEAGVQWLRSGDKLAVQDRETQATQVYQRAAEQFEHARNLAAEIRPDRVSEVEHALEATEDRLDGSRPTDTVPENPVAFERSEEADEYTGEEPVEEGIEGLSFHNSWSTDTQSHEFPSPARSEHPTPFEQSGSDGASLLDRIQAQKQAVGSTNGRSGRSETASPSPPAAAENDSPDPSPEDLRDRLESLDEDRLLALVGRLWEAEGWTTSVLDGAGDAVYDLVAMAEDGDNRALLWVVAATDGPVDGTVLDQCATTMQNSLDTDEVVVVTTASRTPSAESAAEQSGVSLVGSRGLARRLLDAGLAGAVEPRQ